MNAIAVLTVTPSNDLLEFYSGFVRQGYRVFVVIDDKNFKVDNAKVKAKYDGLSLIQIEDYECQRAGFVNLNAMIRKSGGARHGKKLCIFLLP